MRKQLTLIFLIIPILFSVRHSIADTSPATLPAEHSSKKYTLGIITQRGKNDPFWGVVEDIMEAACNDFGMNLIRYHARSNQRNMIRAVDQAIKDAVDILIFPNFKEAAPVMLERSHTAKLPVYLFNADIHTKHKYKTGKPRGKYPYWLGSMMSDDQQAGVLLARHLIQSAYKKHLATPSESLGIIALAGTFVETPSIERVVGLKQYASSRKDVTINQVVHAFWETEQAYIKTKRLLKRYPDSKIIWSASDHMALGSIRAIQDQGRKPGQDILTGGVDWSKAGITQVQNGFFETSIGGNVADAAWIAVMLYDYLQGIDFADEGLERPPRSMIAFPIEHADTYLSRIKNQDWDAIDFTRFSKVLNPGMEKYHFDNSVLFMPASTE